MKKVLALSFVLVLALGALTACGGNSDSGSSSASTSSTSSVSASSASSSSSSDSSSSQSTQTQYMTAQDLKQAMDDHESDLLLVDVRKVADYDQGHIEGAVTADMDAAKNGDMANGEATMKEALTEATGSENGDGMKIVLICYSGNAYAEAATKVLDAINADMSNVYTLQGGMKEWDAQYPNTTVTE